MAISILHTLRLQFQQKHPDHLPDRVIEQHKTLIIAVALKALTTRFNEEAVIGSARQGSAPPSSDASFTPHNPGSTVVTGGIGSGEEDCAMNATMKELLNAKKAGKISMILAAELQNIPTEKIPKITKYSQQVFSDLSDRQARITDNKSFLHIKIGGFGTISEMLDFVCFLTNKTSDMFNKGPDPLDDHTMDTIARETFHYIGFLERFTDSPKSDTEHAFFEAINSLQTYSYKDLKALQACFRHIVSIQLNKEIDINSNTFELSAKSCAFVSEISSLIKELQTADSRTLEIAKAFKPGMKSRL
ncbi:MAG: hypothetical protein VW378_03245 [bacterium]